MTRKQAIMAASLAGVMALALNPASARADDMADMRSQIAALAAAMKAMQEHQAVLEQKLAASEAARAAAVAQASVAPAASAGSGSVQSELALATATARARSAPLLTRLAADNAAARQQEGSAEDPHQPPGTIGPNPALANNQPAGKGASILIPGLNTVFKFGGLIKIDAYDDLSGASLNTVPTDASSIPIRGTTQANRKDNFGITARQTRFYVGSETDTKFGTLRSFLEADFYGTAGTALITNPVSPRLRHAYLSLGKWTVGQTWSVFFDIDSAPETLDLTGPVGNAYAIRQPLIRYQTPIGRNSQLTLGIENPEADFLGADHTTNFPIGASLSTRVLNKIPDFTARYTYKTDTFRISAAGVVRYINLDTGGASLPFLGRNGAFNFAGHAATWAFGGQLTASAKLWGRDTAMIGLNGGPGIGRYLMEPQDAAFAIGVAPNGATNANPGNGAVLGTDGKLRSIFSWGAVASYKHIWSKTIRSNLTIGYQHIGDPDNTLPINFPGTMESFHGNVIWSPLPQISFGVEYSHEYLGLDGQTTANKALGYGNSGITNRLQLTAQYSLF